MKLSDVVVIMVGGCSVFWLVVVIEHNIIRGYPANRIFIDLL